VPTPHGCEHVPHGVAAHEKASLRTSVACGTALTCQPTSAADWSGCVYSTGVNTAGPEAVVSGAAPVYAGLPYGIADTAHVPPRIFSHVKEGDAAPLSSRTAVQSTASWHDCRQPAGVWNDCCTVPLHSSARHSRRKEAAASRAPASKPTAGGSVDVTGAQYRRISPSSPTAGWWLDCHTSPMATLPAAHGVKSYLATDSPS